MLRLKGIWSMDLFVKEYQHYRTWITSVVKSCISNTNVALLNGIITGLVLPKASDVESTKKIQIKV